MPLFNLRKDMDKIRADMGKKFDGIPSGLISLDKEIMGFGKGELCIIGGREGQGKSSLARDILLYNSLPEDKCSMSLYCTMEMPSLLVCNLMASTLAKVNYRAIEKGYASPKEVERFNIKCDELIQYQLFIQDDSCITPETIRNDILVMLKEYTINLLIVDYLQLMSLHRQVESRQVEIQTISRELKALAMEFNIPVIALSQLNRKAEYRENTRPRINDLRESGSLGHDASKVILIHRPSYYTQQDDPNAEDDGEAELIICKQRGGKNTIVECGFIGEWTTFKDIPGDF